MKNIRNLKILFILTLLAFQACSDDESVKLTEASHRIIATSEMDFQNTINIDGHIDFADLSQGVTSRTWTFPENVVDISGAPDEQTSDKNIVKAFFRAAGEYDVTLHQVFKSEAYADASTILTGSTELDTTIVVTVLGDVKAQIKANYINDDGTLGASLALTDNAENEITASKSVRLSYTTDGAPTSSIWNLSGAKPDQVVNSEEDVDARYSKLGSHDLQFIVSRERPFGADTVYIKNFIKVIPSTDPVELDGLFKKDENIAIEFSREMDATTLNKDDFSVSITTSNEEVINPIIKNVSIDSDEGNLVLISLDGESVYNDDQVKVSYTPGLLSTLDAVNATAFTDEAMTFKNYNLLQDTNYDYSFENLPASNWPYLWWGGAWGEYDFDISSAQSQEGSKSAYVEFRPNGGMIVNHTDATGAPAIVSLEAGKTYEVGLWVNVVETWYSGTYPLDGFFVSDIRFYPASFGFEAATTFFTEDFPIGEWVYTNAFITPSANEDVNFRIRGYSGGANETLKFYMDNISVSEVELRP